MEPFLHQNDQFSKTGSGQTQRRPKTRLIFLQGDQLRRTRRVLRCCEPVMSMRFSRRPAGGRCYSVTSEKGLSQTKQVCMKNDRFCAHFLMENEDLSRQARDKDKDHWKRRACLSREREMLRCLRPCRRCALGGGGQRSIGTPCGGAGGAASAGCSTNSPCVLYHYHL